MDEGLHDLRWHLCLRAVPLCESRQEERGRCERHSWMVGPGRAWEAGDAGMLLCGPLLRWCPASADSGSLKVGMEWEGGAGVCCE